MKDKCPCCGMRLSPPILEIVLKKLKQLIKETIIDHEIPLTNIFGGDWSKEASDVFEEEAGKIAGRIVRRKR